MMRLLSLLVLIGLPLAGVAQSPQSMDVLFIAVDDLNDWVGVLEGHPQARTPNIDRLAARGITFSNAHSPSALCNPSRTALLTGLRPATSGVYGNGPDWREEPVFRDVATLPRFFRSHGYRSLGAGKIFHAASFSDRDLEGYNDPDAWDAFYPSLTRQMPDEVGPVTRPANGNPLSRWFDWRAVVAEDDAMADGQVVSWVERQLLDESGSPRFIAAGIYRPHLPWYVPQAYFDLHPLDEVELPEVRADDLDDLPQAGRAGSFQSREWHDWIVAEGRWHEGVQAYLASISFADAMVGRLLDALDRSGRAQRTIVVLFGDHGYHLGEKQRWRKQTLWEESTHVPLIVVAPGVAKPGTRSARPVSLMDIYPTLAELAGLEVPDHVEGRSLVALMVDPEAQWLQPALTTYGYRNHAVRSEHHRYIRYADGSEELYDHRSDPQEWTNLAARRDYAAVKAELARWLPTHDAEPL